MYAMSWLLVVLGVAILAWTAREAWYGESDLTFVSDWFPFDVSRDQNPLLFWIAIGTGVCTGVGAIVAGLL